MKRCNVLLPHSSASWQAEHGTHMTFMASGLVGPVISEGKTDRCRHRAHHLTCRTQQAVSQEKIYSECLTPTFKDQWTRMQHPAWLHRGADVAPFETKSSHHHLTLPQGCTPGFSCTVGISVVIHIRVPIFTVVPTTPTAVGTGCII